MRGVQNVIIDGHVGSKEVQVIIHVPEKAADHCGQVDHIFRSVQLKDPVCIT